MSAGQARGGFADALVEYERSIRRASRRFHKIDSSELAKIDKVSDLTLDGDPRHRRVEPQEAAELKVARVELSESSRLDSLQCTSIEVAPVGGLHLERRESVLLRLEHQVSLAAHLHAIALDRHPSSIAIHPSM